MHTAIRVLCREYCPAQCPRPAASLSRRVGAPSGVQLAARFRRRPLKTGVAAAALRAHGGPRERSDSFDSRPEAVREREMHGFAASFLFSRDSTRQTPRIQT